MGLQTGCKDDSFPVVSVQSDWDNTLMTPGSQVWTSYKFKDSPSVHGKVICKSSSSDKNQLKYESTEGFIVKLINNLTLEINLPEIKHKATLLAPITSHSNIHSNSITCFDVTSKGIIVSASCDGKLMLWNSDKEGQKFQLELEGHKGEVYKCKFFPSEKVVLSCGSDMSLRIWCALTGQCPVRLVGHTQSVTDCAIVDRGKNVLSVSKDGTARLWNCANAECLGIVVQVPGSINCCQIQRAPPCLTLVQPTHSPSPREVGTEGKLLLLGCDDGMVYCVGLQNRNLIFSVNCDSPVNCLCFNSEFTFVVGCQNGKLLEYQISDGKGLLIGSRHNSNSAVLSLLPERNSGYFYASRADGTVTLKHCSDSSLQLTGSNCDPIYHISSNDQYVYTSCRDQIIRMYDRTSINKVLNN